MHWDGFLRSKQCWCPVATVKLYCNMAPQDTVIKNIYCFQLSLCCVEMSMEVMVK